MVDFTIAFMVKATFSWIIFIILWLALALHPVDAALGTLSFEVFTLFWRGLSMYRLSSDFLSLNKHKRDAAMVMGSSVVMLVWICLAITLFASHGLPARFQPSQPKPPTIRNLVDTDLTSQTFDL
jgi:hypothetical protein